MTASDTRPFTIRLRPGEVEQVDREAKAAGLSRSDWVRRRLLDDTAADGNLSPAKDSAGDDTRRPRRGGDHGPVRNVPEDARVASAGNLGERDRPGRSITEPPTATGVVGYDYPAAEVCRHPRWRRVGGVCTRCGVRVQ